MATKHIKTGIVGEGAAVPCTVGKGVEIWAGHRLQAVLGVGEWQCRDCQVKVGVDREVWAEWVREVILRADELLGEE